MRSRVGWTPPVDAETSCPSVGVAPAHIPMLFMASRLRGRVRADLLNTRCRSREACNCGFHLRRARARSRALRARRSARARVLVPTIIFSTTALLYSSQRPPLDHSFGCAQAGSGAGGSKPSTQGKNLSPGLRGEQHCENCGASSEPSIVQKLARR